MMSTAIEPLRIGENFARLREVLDLIGAMRAIRGALTTSEGLRQALEVLLRLAALVGVEGAWVERVRQALADERTFELVLAIVRYVARLLAPESADDVRASEETPRFDAQGLVEWLPIVLALVRLWQVARGGP